VGLIVAIGVVFVLQQIVDLASGPRISPFLNYLALDPQNPPYYWIWQLWTFQFLHGGPIHLLFNCLVLYFCGRFVEEALGRAAFLKVYFFSGFLGGLLQLLCSLIFPKFFGASLVVGASAGVCGLLAVLTVLHWDRPITLLLFFVIPIHVARAKYLLYAMMVFNGLAIFLDRSSHIAHAAHLGGLIGGLVLTRYFLNTHISFVWPAVLSPRRSSTDQPDSGRWQGFWSKPEAEEIPPSILSGEFISREVDPILDKISAHGIDSLSERERKILEMARSRMQKK